MINISLKSVNKIQKYTFLIVALSAALTLAIVLKLQYIPQIQFLAVTILVMFYLLWAMVHHFIDKTLTLEIMIEYVLTALLALIVLYGILL